LFVSLLEDQQPIMTDNRPSYNKNVSIDLRRGVQQLLGWEIGASAWESGGRHLACLLSEERPSMRSIVVLLLIISLGCSKGGSGPTPPSPTGGPASMTH
jgi:hypothetical protein